MSVTTRVVKNSGLLILASVINNIMTFILTLFTARYLGTYDFGLISSATSLVGVFGIFCDLGLSTYAIREVSRDKSKTSLLFGTTLFLRIIFSIITFIVYYIFVMISNFTYNGTLVMILFGVYMVLNSIVTFYYSLFQSNEKMHYQTIGNAIYSVSVLLIILLIIFNGGDVITVTLGYPIAIGFSLIYSVIIGFKYYPRFKLSLKKDYLKTIFLKGIPFGITAVFTSIYFWIALIILTYLSGSVAVGLFSSSQKLLLVIAAVYTLISNAIFPVMSELFTSNKEKLVGLYHKIMKYMLILGIPIATIISLYSSEIIEIIYGTSYVEGSGALTILIWAAVFMFLSSMSSTLLGAINRQVDVTRVALRGAIFSIILNALLILKYSYIGASIATVCTEFLILVMMLLALRKTEYHLTIKGSYKHIIRVLIANIIFVAILSYLNLSFIIALPISVVLYLVLLLITQSLNKEDREIIKDLITDFLPF